MLLMPQRVVSVQRLLIAFALLLTASRTLPAQQTGARPDRGVTPGGSYSVSDIENINLQNGNVQLSIPLASLPPMAGDKLGFTLKLNYNSKLWNITRNELVAADLPYRTYVTAAPQLSDAGGWAIDGAYDIIIRDATEDFSYQIPPPPNPNDGEAVIEYQRLTQYSWKKVILRTPDGAEHELRPTANYSPYGGVGFLRSYLWGYYKETPQATGQSMRYNTSDGTYLSAIINPPNHASGVNWSIFLPDGTQVIAYASGIQRIRDNNGNAISIFGDGNGTHYQDEQTGREIRVTYYPDGAGGNEQYKVWYQTVEGGWQHIDVNLDETFVRGKIYDVQDWNSSVFDEQGYQGVPCKRRQQFPETMVRIVREVVFPATEAGTSSRRFNFNYNSEMVETATTPEVYWACGSQPQNYTRDASIGLGALSRIITPSGAAVEYSYSQAGVHDFIDLLNPDNIARETLNFKKLYPHGLGGPPETWEYNIPNEPTSRVSSIKDPNGSITGQAYFPIDPNFARVVGNVLEVRSGLVFYTTDGVTETWKHWVAGSQIATGSDGFTAFNPHVDAEYTALVGSTLMSARTFEHDFNGNVTMVKEYDWFDSSQVTRDETGVPNGPPAGMSPRCVTTTSFYNSAPDANSPNSYMSRTLTTNVPSIINAVIETSAGTSQTQFGYDNQAYGVAPIVGNLTSQSTWDNLDNKWITSSQTYGAYGNLSTRTNARGKVTRFFYEDATHALPNRVVVDPQNGTGPQTSWTTYDYYTGLVTIQTDPSGHPTTISYDNPLLGTVDPFGRPGMVTGPSNNGQSHITRTLYYDSARSVTVLSDLNIQGDGLLKTEVFSDTLGRTIESRRYEGGANYIVTQQTYDNLGRVSRVSNPYRPSQNENPVWTTTNYDGVGRVISVTTPDLAVVNTFYNANQVLVRDQAGKERMSQTNALGQLTDVWEITSADNETEAISFPGRGEVTAGYRTRYQYDELGNLITVMQRQGTAGTLQTRTFNYDSLSRLRSAANPESGTITYSYDDNGNLTQKTDARGVIANYSYDALNRNTSIVYVNDPTGTLPITRTYDQAVNGTGRLYQTQTTGATGSLTTVDSYDASGRPLVQRQQFYLNNVWSPSYKTERTYNLAGGVTSQKYPSDRTVAYTYDNAGRTSDFTGYLGDGMNRSYSSGIVYSPFGGLSKEQFGTDTPVYQKLAYNSRGQLAEIRASTSYTGQEDLDWNRGKFVNWYSPNCGGALCNNSDNNGNLRKQETFIPPYNQTSSSTIWRQQFDYDDLNRLQRVQEDFGAPGVDWQQEYKYDRWGNRKIHQTNTWGAGIPKPNFGVDTSNNRLSAPSGYTMSYDAAGNLVNDTYTGQGQRTYDAENRMAKAWANDRWQEYTYNGDGQRVRRTVDGTTTWQMYGMDGELLAEYAAGGATTSPQKEYGYRNGQMLISADSTATPTPTPTPTPSPITSISHSTNSTLGQTISVTKPTSIAVGDVLIAVIASSFAYGGLPTPAGWTPIRHIDQGAQIIVIDTYYRIVDGTEPANWTWQFGSPNGNVNARATATIVAYRGVSNAAPIGSTNVSCCVHGTITTVGSITTTTANNMVLAVFAEGMADNSYSLTAGFNLVTAVTNGDPNWGNHHILGEQLRLTPGATGTQTATNGKDTHEDAAQLIALQPGSVGSPASYAAFANFSSLQGQGNWYYLESDGTPMSYDAANNWWQNPAHPYSLLWSWGGHPGETVDAVRQWRAPTNGPVRITGTASDGHSGCGDGVIVLIKKGTEVLWQQTIQDGNSTGFSFDLTTAVAPGDQLNFVINKRSANNSCDSTVLNPTITYQANAPTTSMNWIVTDQLGKPRMIFDKTGDLANVKRHDYLPFGEELVAGQGQRSVSLGYSADNIRQKFTSKERDNETGLDYFLARYYSSTQGRFVSPDEFSGGPDKLYGFADDASENPTFYADLTNPQSLNKYQYTYNNPLNMVDPDGHCPTEPCAETTTIKTSGPAELRPYQVVTAVVVDAAIAVGKVGANLVIGASNIGNGAFNGTQTQHYDSASSVQEVVMHAVEVFTLVSPILGRAGPTAVLSAESKSAAVAAEASAIERTAASAPYSRPSGATTAAQRASVQGKPCSVCGESAPRMNAGHKEALVKEYYRTGTIDRTRMRDIGSVRSECPTCSNREGASMSRYSIAMRNQIPR